MYGALEASTSGLIAQRTRLEAITQNLINRDTFLDATGKNNPYKRREVLFAPGNPAASHPAARATGVHAAGVIEHDSFQERYEPESRWADARGYVKYPDINPVVEQLNAYEAQRAYEANLVVAEATKTMVGQALLMIA